MRAKRINSLSSAMESLRGSAVITRLFTSYTGLHLLCVCSMSQALPASSSSSSRPVVFITGCSSGIGLALARAFHQQGCCVYASARSEEQVKSLQAEGMRSVRLDVSGPQSAIREVVDGIIATEKRIDILVNNAGIGLYGPMVEQVIEDVQQLFQTNVVGLLSVTQVVAPHMMRQCSGKIVNISSVAGCVSIPFGGTYSASKAAVNFMSDALRMELKPFGVQVLNVCPGGVVSDISRNSMERSPLERYRSGWYGRLYDFIEMRATIAQRRGIPTATFATRLANQILRPTLPRRYFDGSESTVVKWIVPLLPQWLLDFLMSRSMGLHQLASK